VSADEDRLDTRLRRLFGRLDARPGFESRAAARIAALPARADRLADLRAQFERRREQQRLRLTREAWTSGLTIAGIGAAALALVWRYAPEIQQWTLTRDPSSALDPLQIGGYSSVVLLAIFWPLLRKLPLLRNL
jgi:hypothetical protein